MLFRSRQTLSASGGRVSLLGGAAAEQFTVDYFGPSVDIALFDGVTDAMRATELQADGIVANVQDLPIWNFYSNAFPGLRAAGAPVGQGFYVGLTRRKDAALLQAANAALLQGRRSGRLQNIFARYGMWNATQQKYTDEQLATADSAVTESSAPAVTESVDPRLAQSTSPTGFDAVQIGRAHV